MKKQTKILLALVAAFVVASIFPCAAETRADGDWSALVDGLNARLDAMEAADARQKKLIGIIVADDVEALKRDLASGAGADEIFGDSTPLSHAVYYGAIKCARLLVARGADIRFRNSRGISVLMWTVLHDPGDSGPKWEPYRKKRAEVLSYLLSLGLTDYSDLHDQAGNHISMLVALYDDPEDFAPLKRAGVPIDGAMDFAGSTPLLFASTFGSLASVKELVRLGVDYRVTNVLGQNAWDLAGGKDAKAIQAYLASLGLGKSQAMKDQDTLSKEVEKRDALVAAREGSPDWQLADACDKKDFARVRELVEKKGANPNTTLGGMPSLYLCLCGTPNRDILRCLLAHGAKVNVLNECSGDTPLAVASANRDLESAKILLAAGADPNLSESGMTPMFYAQMNEDQAMMDVLAKAGAKKVK